MIKTISEINKYKKILAIDFDGTIVENTYPEIGNLRKNAKEIINKLYNENYYIIIWTCRSGYELKLVKLFLDNNKIKFHKINSNSDFIDFNPYPKIYADIYIDDRQLNRIPEWNEIYRIIKQEY